MASVLKRGLGHGVKADVALTNRIVGIDDAVAAFHDGHKAAGGLGFEDKARAVLNRGRYSGATT